MFAGAAALYGTGFAYTRRFITGHDVSGLSLSATQVSLGAVQLAVVLPLAAAPSGSPSLNTVLSMLGLGVLGSGLGYVLNFDIIRRAGATTASTVAYLIPVFSTALGVLVLSEPLGWHEPVGAIVVLFGIALAQGRLGRARLTANRSSSSV